MKVTSDTLKVSRPNLIQQLKKNNSVRPARFSKEEDEKAAARNSANL
jgi:hypothetical protein